MNPTLLILKNALILSTITCFVIGCSSDENSEPQTKPENEAFQDYKASMEKAESIEQTLLQSDKIRRDALERQQ